VQAIERFLGDEGLDLIEDLPGPGRTAQQVAVLGSGPAGLTCAYFLARNGVPVRVFEADSRPGGMLRSGIPAYRLPRSILDREIEKIIAAGIEIEVGCRVGVDRSFRSIQEDFAALFVATGAHQSRGLSCPAEEKASTFSGLEFLRSVNIGQPPALGKQVLVIGGGNTAMDAARVAVRLGAETVVVYRRTCDEMPAHPSEVEDAMSEGVQFSFLASPVAVRRKHSGIELELVRMRLSAPDASGRPRPVEIPESNYILEADSLIVAIGEQADLSFYRPASNVFVGGDAATGPSTVIDAIAAGRKGAEDILHFLGLETAVSPSPLLPRDEFRATGLRRDYFSPLNRVSQQRLPPEARLGGFAEIVSTVPRSAAQFESHRCISCGVCNECNNCWLFCPESAVHHRNGHYAIDLDYCKGCGICVEECPRGVIDLVEEEA
jgi:2-oxoacid:acceptor oxidoreductase delta subunit (pyruvate/2-ketoisovalerate family)